MPYGATAGGKCGGRVSYNYEKHCFYAKLLCCICPRLIVSHVLLKREFTKSKRKATIAQEAGNDVLMRSD